MTDNYDGKWVFDLDPDNVDWNFRDTFNTKDESARAAKYEFLRLGYDPAIPPKVGRMCVATVVCTASSILDDILDRLSSCAESMMETNSLWGDFAGEWPSSICQSPTTSKELEGMVAEILGKISRLSGQLYEVDNIEEVML